MPRGRIKIDPIVYIMEKVGHHMMVLEGNPQCEDCEYMQFIQFNYEIFANVIRKKYCPPCPKFNGKEYDCSEEFD